MIGRIAIAALLVTGVSQAFACGASARSDDLERTKIVVSASELGDLMGQLYPAGVKVDARYKDPFGPDFQPKLEVTPPTLNR